MTKVLNELKLPLMHMRVRNLVGFIKNLCIHGKLVDEFISVTQNQRKDLADPRALLKLSAVPSKLPSLLFSFA